MLQDFNSHEKENKTKVYIFLDFLVISYKTRTNILKEIYLNALYILFGIRL